MGTMSVTGYLVSVGSPSFFKFDVRSLCSKIVCFKSGAAAPNPVAVDVTRVNIVERNSIGDGIKRERAQLKAIRPTSTQRRYDC